jgi:hypothetical protein
MTQNGVAHAKNNHFFVKTNYIYGHLGPLPSVGGPDQPGQVGARLGRLHLAQRLRQHGNAMALGVDFMKPL